ncbi:hypothetical protein [Helicobacter canis]|uniref:Uncharacterized protein n=1 Tax=Helicobacter canis TaxID=29419 RepID=A0A377J358_9HELI|nr:hypothetical protein [Helicobacter canis]STO96213.1 Uncharacterised protein [Helicobacter canis]STO96278.1 Uncharacterised protein [Helicobacter canis]
MSKTIYYQNKQIELKYGRINHLIPADMWHCGLSLQAIGVASYIYTLPKEWKLSVSHIAKQLMISPNSCRKYLREIFTNTRAIKVFKGVEREANTYDLEEGFYEYPYVDEPQEVANFTSSVAKDVSVPRKRRVLIVQTETQRYLLNLCFARGSLRGSEATEAIHNEKVDSSMDRHALQSKARDDDKKADPSSEITPNKNAQNLRTINKNLLQDSYKDSSSKRTREKAKDLASFLDLKAFNEKEQEAIKLWIRYKQESSKARLKPSQIDFQLRKIQRLKEQGQDICAVIEKSVDMGWQGLFPVIASETKQSIKVDRHADKSARDDRVGGAARDDGNAHAVESTNHTRLTPKMPKNLGGKAVLCVK